MGAVFDAPPQRDGFHDAQAARIGFQRRHVRVAVFDFDVRTTLVELQAEFDRRAAVQDRVRHQFADDDHHRRTRRVGDVREVVLGGAASDARRMQVRIERNGHRERKGIDTFALTGNLQAKPESS